MEYRKETAEVKAKVHDKDENLCLLIEDSVVHVPNTKNIKIPKTFIIPNDVVIQLGNDQDWIYINDLDDMIKLDNKDEFTIKLSIEIPILPISIPRFIRNTLIKIEVIPYFKCDCWVNGNPRTLTIYTKERFERNIEQRKIFEKKIVQSIPDGEYSKITPFCPYYGNCISDFPDTVHVSSDRKQVTDFEKIRNKRERW